MIDYSITNFFDKKQEVEIVLSHQKEVNNLICPRLICSQIFFAKTFFKGTQLSNSLKKGTV